ncbi:MAG: hypothetical protein ACK559_18055, partial [bacterium]
FKRFAKSVASWRRRVLIRRCGRRRLRGLHRPRRPRLRPRRHQLRRNQAKGRGDALHRPGGGVAANERRGIQREGRGLEGDLGHRQTQRVCKQQALVGVQGDVFDAHDSLVQVETSMQSNRRGEHGNAARLEQRSLRFPRG